ncbi:dual specificity protein phosphatase [Myxococcus stipitatus DSM 14675]|uniref:Dual specificity protein phosphatase n=1 Tax=Myxococcus stipitatus (strain DSM 14675 / JCM 12634 / Mx s8) TaxID=1278073 RepID=L7UI15_MYXSD|nr:dual specificity protein phosphatase [Myxococcus stipitatus]AGC46094.1 dual specificity protein phosphatase [Myxococcus stipitatus DSM 14675]
MMQAPGREEAEVLLLDGTRLPGGFAVEFQWLTARLAMGGMIGTAANVGVLEAARITHVINLQEEFDDTALLKDTGLVLRWLAVPDSLEPFPAEALGEALRFYRQALERSEHRVYVHCMAGKNRSPLFVYALLRAEGWTEEGAVEVIRRASPAALLRRGALEAVEHLLPRLVEGRGTEAVSRCD